jgi:hypothetical protein
MALADVEMTALVRLDLGIECAARSRLDVGQWETPVEAKFAALVGPESQLRNGVGLGR